MPAPDPAASNSQSAPGSQTTSSSQPPSSSPSAAARRDVANLKNADVIVDTRAALATFEDEARGVIESVLMKSQATLRWLQEDAPHYWIGAARQANERTSAARSDLDRCKLKTVAGNRDSCIEEKQAFLRAKDREAFCRDQRTKTTATATSLQQTIDELKTRIVQLQRWLDGDLPRLQARLHQTGVAVSAYTAIRPASTRAAPPTTPDTSPSSTTNSGPSRS